jgi:hypothetical protein
MALTLHASEIALMSATRVRKPKITFSVTEKVLIVWRSLSPPFKWNSFIDVFR